MDYCASKVMTPCVKEHRSLRGQVSKSSAGGATCALCGVCLRSRATECGDTSHHTYEQRQQHNISKASYFQKQRLRLSAFSHAECTFTPYICGYGLVTTYTRRRREYLTCCTITETWLVLRVSRRSPTIGLPDETTDAVALCAYTIFIYVMVK